METVLQALLGWKELAEVLFGYVRRRAFLFLTKGSGPFCSSAFMNELVSWYEARFSYSLKTEIIQNSSVKKQDLLGVV